MATAKTKTVSVYVPKVPGEAPILWVALNGKSWSIPRGKRVEVPEYVADIIYRRERNMEVADEYVKQKQLELEEAQRKYNV